MKNRQTDSAGIFFSTKCDPLDCLRCVAGLRPEKYAFERYVEFWRLLGYELFDGDTEATNILYVLSASRILEFLESDKCAVSTVEKSNSKNHIQKEILSPDVCRLGMQLLTNYYPFWDNLFEVAKSATIGTAIIDELIKLEGVAYERDNSRPSLSKAIANARSRRDLGGQWSLSSWKGIWRDYATDLPLIWAIWEMKMDLRLLCGENSSAVEHYQELITKQPGYLLQLLSLARTAQLKMLQLVDPASKANKRFLRFPKEVPTLALPDLPAQKNLDEIELRFGPRDQY